MEPLDYRTQARAVRAAAQSRLRQLREERREKLRKRAPSPRAADTSEADVAAERPPKDPPELAISSSAQAVADAAADAADHETVELETADPGSAAEVVEVGAPETTADDGSSEDEMAPDDPPVAADELASVEAPREEEVGEECDLSSLPGVGSGLIWALRQQGITSIADLAAADAADVTERLNLIGQLLDIESWIAFARSQMDGAEGSGSTAH